MCSGMEEFLGMLVLVNGISGVSEISESVVYGGSEISDCLIMEVNGKNERKLDKVSMLLVKGFILFKGEFEE